MNDITWKFTSLEQMAAFLARKGSEVRERSRKSKTPRAAKELASEAFGWEQAASIVANAIINTDPIVPGMH